MWLNLHLELEQLHVKLNRECSQHHGIAALHAGDEKLGEPGNEARVDNVGASGFSEREQLDVELNSEHNQLQTPAQRPHRMQAQHNDDELHM